MEKNEFMFGNISSDKLIEAQGVIIDVMHFVEKNKDSDDPEARKAAKTAMCILAIDDMMRRPVMSMLAKSMVEQIEAEKSDRGGANCDSSAPRSISIPIPTGDKS